MVSNVILGCVAGIAAHYIRPVLKKDFRDSGLFAIACYTVGVLVTLPFFLLIYADLGGKEIKKPFFAYILAFFSVGAGTTFGHWMMPDR